MRPVYVTGHKNPDTDSIVAAIAYAAYKKKTSKLDYIPSRIGPVSSDTEWLLEKFGFEDPLHIYTAKSTIREIDFDKANLVSPDLTVKETLDILQGVETKTVYVSDENRKLLGMATMSLITNLLLEDNKTIAKLLKTVSLENFCKVLKAKIVVKPESFKTNGIVDLSPHEEAILKPGTIVITSGPRKMMNAIKEKVGIIIVVNNIEVTDEMIKLAKKNNVAIVKSRYPALQVSRYIALTPEIKKIMTPAEKLTFIKDSWTTDEATEKIINTRFRSYPIVDGHGYIIGALARYHLLTYKKKKLVLVDHNEKKQSIDDIDFGEVIEIIDHHRFGGFESDNPINIQTMIVGATCTIIANKFLNDEIEMSKNLAGLLLGGIVADTMNFKSPTTTKLDIDTARKLEEMTGEKADDLMQGIIDASASLVDRRVAEIVNADFKEFIAKGHKIGLAQAVCKSFDEYKAVRTPIGNYLEEQCLNGGYDLFAIMLTDPNGSGSYVIYRGKKSDAVEKAFPNMNEVNFVNHLVSRKKQLLPSIIASISE